MMSTKDTVLEQPQLSFGQLLQKKRLLQGLTINGACEKMQMAWETLNKFEKDEKTPGRVTLKKLSKFYKITESTLNEYGLILEHQNINIIDADEPEETVFNVFATTADTTTPIMDLIITIEKIMNRIADKMEKSSALEKAILTLAYSELEAIQTDLEGVVVIDEAF